MIAYLQDQGHADLCMELQMTMEQPVARICGSETYDGVTAIRYRYRVLDRRTLQITFELILFFHFFDLRK